METIVRKHPEYGDPSKFFGPSGRAMWVTFTVTMHDPTFLNCLTALTGTVPSRTGLVTLTDSPWLITLAPFPKPHFLKEDPETTACGDTASIPSIRGRMSAERRRCGSAAGKKS